MHGTAGRCGGRHAASGIEAQVDAHCRECNTCRDLLHDLKEIRAAAATLDRFTPPPAVWRRSPLKRVRHRGRSWAAPQSWWGLAAAAVLIIMAGTAGWLALGPGRNAAGRAAVRARAQRSFGTAAGRTALRECHHRARTTDRQHRQHARSGCRR